MRGFKKDDVEFHADHGPLKPAVNVKVYTSISSVKLPMDLGSYKEAGATEWTHVQTHPDFTHEWLDEWAEANQELAMDYWQMACELGWEQLQQIAEDIWPARFYGTKVYSEGRMGGWAVVDGINTDVDSWDAIELNRWARFAKLARQEADGVPRSYVDLVYHNVFEMEHDTDPEQIAAEATN